MSVWVKTASTASKLGSLCSQQQMYTKPVVSGDKWFGKEHWVLTAISHGRAGTSVSPASPHTRLMKWYLQAQLQAGLDCEGHDSTQEQPPCSCPLSGCFVSDFQTVETSATSGSHPDCPLVPERVSMGHRSLKSQGEGDGEGLRKQ